MNDKQLTSQEKKYITGEPTTTKHFRARLEVVYGFADVHYLTRNHSNLYKRIGNTTATRLDRCYIRPQDELIIIHENIYVDSPSDHRLYHLQFNFKKLNERDNIKTSYLNSPKKDEFISFLKRMKNVSTDWNDSELMKWQNIKKTIANSTKMFLKNLHSNRVNLDITQKPKNGFLFDINQTKFLSPCNGTEVEKINYINYLNKYGKYLTQRTDSDRAVNINYRRKQLIPFRKTKTMPTIGVDYITAADGTIIADKDSCIKHLTEHFRDMLTTTQEHKSLTDYLIELDKSVYEEHQTVIDWSSIFRPVNIVELNEIIKQNAKGTSPGPDQISRQILRSLPEEHLHALKDWINNYLTNKSSMDEIFDFEAFILPIPKVEDNWLEINQFRPITVYNVDIRILHSLIAKRLQNILNNVIHQNQAAYLKGRNIQNTLHHLIYAQQIIKNKKLPYKILKIDLQNAFNSVNHETVIEFLQYHGLEKECASHFLLQSFKHSMLLN